MADTRKRQMQVVMKAVMRFELYKQKRYNNTMLFRMESEIPPVQQIRLKVEINCYEHFNVLGLTKVPFSVNNKWFSGSCKITTYHLDEC